MGFNAKLHTGFGVVVMSACAMGCMSAPQTGSSASTSQKQSGVIFTAKASAASKSSLGVAAWHTTLEGGSRNAIVLDGQDHVGKVKYLATSYLDASNAIHVKVMLPAKGELVWDPKTKAITRNTLPASARAYALGIYKDYQAAHPTKSTAAYSAKVKSSDVALTGLIAASGMQILASPSSASTAHGLSTRDFSSTVSGAWSATVNGVSSAWSSASNATSSAVSAGWTAAVNGTNAAVDTVANTAIGALHAIPDVNVNAQVGGSNNIQTNTNISDGTHPQLNLNMQVGGTNNQQANQAIQQSAPDAKTDPSQDASQDQGGSQSGTNPDGSVTNTNPDGSSGGDSQTDPNGQGAGDDSGSSDGSGAGDNSGSGAGGKRRRRRYQRLGRQRLVDAGQQQWRKSRHRRRRRRLGQRRLR